MSWLTDSLRKLKRQDRRQRRSVQRDRRILKRDTRVLKRTRAKIEKRRRQLQALHGGPRTAIHWALDQVGTTESPPNSNRGPKVSKWQRRFGEWLVGLAWCGVFVGNALLEAGVKVNSRVASVAAIEDDARAGRNGFEKLVPLSEARPGDVAILFGRGVHTELIQSVDHARGILNDIGGNTSSGSAGSQSNGGGVYRRARPFSVVHAVARPRYP